MATTLISLAETFIRFLSIQAQDFIEDAFGYDTDDKLHLIPEHSSSGLH